MRHFTIRVLSTVALTLAAACGGSSDEGEQTASEVRTAAATTTTFRMTSADVGEWFFRLSVKAGKVDGYGLQHNERGMPGFAPTKVTGTVDAAGVYELTWLLAFKGEHPVLLKLKPEGNDLVGTVGDASEDVSRHSAARLSPLAAGTMDKDGRPIAVTYQKAGGDPCQVSVTGAEVLGLGNVKVEDAINAKLTAVVPKAESLCKAPVESVLGGAGFGVLRPDLLSYSTYLSANLPNDGVKDEPRQRENIYLADGSSVKLWGEVLTPGKSAEILVEINKIIDSFDERRDMMTAADKAELKGIMAARASGDKLKSEFLLTERGVSFAAPGFSNLRYSSVLVPYAALAPLLVQDGKARSAWAP
ncbi:MAG: hypothetical protein IPG50_14960 [Myxococcales bacterium]|nr:hypothetical protein [Myxococcales bacterium]